MQNDLRLNWLIAVLLCGWLLYLLAPVLTPFIAAGLLAYMGDPLADQTGIDLKDLPMQGDRAIVLDLTLILEQE